jgi:predicted nucleic acid-binding protein
LSFLLDTVTVSVLFNPRRTPKVSAWIDRHEQDLQISALTFGELERGVRKAERQHPAFAQRLAHWASLLQYNYRVSIIDFGLAEALEWGRLSARLGNREPDLQIAATALVHDLTVVTRNVRHFEPAGVRVVNPWEAS